MQIGTAAPKLEELKKANHHFIHHKSVTEDYNVGAFEKDALSKLDKLFIKNDIVIMVGGSGLYVDAVTKGLDDFPEVDPSIRENLNAILKNKGFSELQEQLKKLDPLSYKTIAIDNPHRVIRALEISIGTGKSYSSFLNKEKTDRNFQTNTIGLKAERSIIYERINKRVDLMMEEGLLEEVKSLLPYKNLNALNTVGYKEIFKYLDGDWNLKFAISEIKKNTRRFAKRQLTWYRKYESIFWFDYNSDFESIISTIKTQLP